MRTFSNDLATRDPDSAVIASIVKDSANVIMLSEDGITEAVCAYFEAANRLNGIGEPVHMAAGRYLCPSRPFDLSCGPLLTAQLITFRLLRSFEGYIRVSRLQSREMAIGSVRPSA